MSLGHRPTLDVRLFDFGKLNRVEVIDWKSGDGRVYSHWDNTSNIWLDLQDNERTLKVFIENK